MADATELSAAEREQLDTRGFVLLPSILEPQEVETMLRTLQSLAAADVAGAEEIANLQNVPAAGGAFDVCLTHPRVLSAVKHVLGEQVATLGIREAPSPAPQAALTPQKAYTPHVPAGCVALPGRGPA